MSNVTEPEVVGRPRSPAPFSKSVIEVIKIMADRWLVGDALILDPFAGVGGIHAINEGRERPWEIACIEIEKEWAEQCAEKGPTWCGDFLEFDVTKVPRGGLFDAVITSPTYGNRMADHHEARDGSHRRTYKHYLGRDLSPGNSGAMQWGEGYREFHEQAWKQVAAVLRVGGMFMLNVKDHTRKKELQRVVAWHWDTVRGLGFKEVERFKVPTPGYRYGENKEGVVRWEWVMVFQKT